MKYSFLLLSVIALSSCGEDVKELHDRINALNTTITNLQAESNALRKDVDTKKTEIERLIQQNEIMSEELIRFKKYAPADFEVRMKKIYSMWND